MALKGRNIHVQNKNQTGEHYEHMNITTAACYATLLVLRKLKHLAPYYLRKSLASKLDYDDSIYYLLPQKLLKIIQKVQFAAAKFVLGWYSPAQKVCNEVKSQEDLLQIRWLSMSERRDFHLLKVDFYNKCTPKDSPTTSDSSKTVPITQECCQTKLAIPGTFRTAHLNSSIVYPLKLQRL